MQPAEGRVDSPDEDEDMASDREIQREILTNEILTTALELGRNGSG